MSYTGKFDKVKGKKFFPHRANLGGGKGQARAVVVIKTRKAQKDALRRFRAKKPNGALVATWMIIM